MAVRDEIRMIARRRVFDRFDGAGDDGVAPFAVNGFLDSHHSQMLSSGGVDDGI